MGPHRHRGQAPVVVGEVAKTCGASEYALPGVFGGKVQ